jgi:hypothetical protein
MLKRIDGGMPAGAPADHVIGCSRSGVADAVSTRTRLSMPPSRPAIGGPAGHAAAPVGARPGTIGSTATSASARGVPLAETA